MIKRQIQWLILIFGLGSFILGGCQSQPPIVPTEQSATPEIEAQSTATQISALSSPLTSPVPSPQPTPTISKPRAGQAAIRGALSSNITQRPIAETLFYLTPGLGEQGDLFPPLLAGPQEKDIQGYTDKQGWFTLSNVPPGTYYLIIWAPLSWTPLSYIDGANVGEPIPLDLQPDQTLDLGEMITRWP